MSVGTINASIRGKISRIRETAYRTSIGAKKSSMSGLRVETNKSSRSRGIGQLNKILSSQNDIYKESRR